MTKSQEAIQKLHNAISAYRGSVWKLPDGSTKPMKGCLPQKNAWSRVERWAFRCRQLGINVPEIKP